MLLQAYTYVHVAAGDLRTRMHDRFVNLVHSETGATAAEYALLVALIAVAIIAGARLLGTSINSELSDVAGKVSTAPAAP